MRKAMPGLIAIFILSVAGLPELHTAAAGFRKVSPHFFCLTSGSDAVNTGAVITPEGVLLIDPPPAPDVPAMLNALKSLTSRPVRWVVNTDYQQAANGGWSTFLKQGAAVILSKELNRLADSASVPDPDQPAAETSTSPNPRFLFGQQLHLWPANFEIRILAVKGKARTAGDIVVFLPTEKVLVTGDFFSPSSYPLIDGGPGEGSALGWIDGLKQVIDFVPLLKSAMPQPKPETPVPPEAEKTLEELVTVIPGHGESANLQQMKTLLSAAQKLRTEASRAVRLGRTREAFIKSLDLNTFGEFSNLEAFAGLLFDDLSRK